MHARPSCKIITLLVLLLCIVSCTCLKWTKMSLHRSPMRLIRRNLPSTLFRCTSSSVLKMTAETEFTSITEERSSAVKEILSDIIDPDTGRDIVASNRVVNVDVTSEGTTTITLATRLAQSAAFDQLKQFCILQVGMLEWVTDVKVIAEVISPAPTIANKQQDTQPPTSGIARVKNIIAVSSCKGGVGKSTVSVNLAYSLKQQGFKVGILDADIYGPSLPTMTKPDTTKKMLQGQSIIPLEYEGVKLMSMGFLSPGAAIMRGPMVNQILNQLVTLTAWDELDYLLVDMPPGTGDIQLTLAQIMNITAAVIVTTPQRLSFVDVVKGIDMFDTVQIPCIAVVENMAEYTTYSFDANFFEDTAKAILQTLSSDHTSSATNAIKELLSQKIETQKQPYRLFGEGHLHRLRDMWGMETLITLPLLDDVAQSSDRGIPYVQQHPQSIIASRFQSLATACREEVQRLNELQEKEGNRQLSYHPETQMLQIVGSKSSNTNSNINYSANTAKLPSIRSKALRCACRCAVCVEEMTGRKLLQDDTVSDQIQPLRMGSIGRYAWSIDWSDGHKSLYPWKEIYRLSNSE